MRRREFITLIGSAVASPLVARAQQPAKMKRIALVISSMPTEQMVASYYSFFRVFFEELSRHGFVEGKNLVVERYSGGGQRDRFAQMARDVVDTRPDAIYLMDAVLAVVFKATATGIPIITISIDPVAFRLVPNIARPGGNITGVSVDAGLEVWGKRIGLLKEALPTLSNLCFVAPMQRKFWEERAYGSAIRQAAKAANVTLSAAILEGNIDEASYRRAFAMFEQDRPDALLFNESNTSFTHRAAIVEMAAKLRLPAMYTVRDFAEAGGLMSHSLDLEELHRSAGYQMAQVLSGTNPGDIPFIQVTRLYLTLNLKTAKSLGLEFPATLLGSADFIIE
jgi:putative tryptophan/tyrosine transport system substrate-binding protein